MKHLLNNISEEEKNRIREQHTGGMKIAIDNFKKLVETKSGDVKPYLNEQQSGQTQAPLKLKVFSIYQEEGEDGSPRDAVRDKASYFIDVYRDKDSFEIDNQKVEFQYSVRGRSDRGNGYYYTNEKNSIYLDTCYLWDWGTEKVKTDPIGREYECGEEEFRLSSDGGIMMWNTFGPRGYVFNDNGGDTSNMA